MTQLSNHLVFNTIAELIEALDNAPIIRGRDDSSQDYDNGSWVDTKTYEEAREKMLYGHVYEDIEKEVEKMKAVASAYKRRQHMSVAGFQVNVPLYLQGVPTSMITQSRVLNNKIVTLIYNAAVPHSVSSSSIMETTKELFRKIMSLESEGYRCNVWVTTVHNEGKWGTALRLKTDRETLNARKMMFPLVSSSFNRRIGFKIREVLYEDWIGFGYGSPCYDKESNHKFIVKNLGVTRYELWNHGGLVYEAKGD